jgi:predicted nucleic acid-binding Zn ribbon protein
MERAARVLRKSKQPCSILDDRQTIGAVWPVAVGKAIARHTSHLRLVRKTLVVEAEDMIWQRQLRTLESQIVNRISLLLPGLELESIEFRLQVPRREPQKTHVASASQVTPVPNDSSSDEAEQIADPVLKKVYQLSRRKASA